MQSVESNGILEFANSNLSCHLRQFLFSSGKWIRLSVVVLPTADEESNLSEFAPQYPVKNANPENFTGGGYFLV